MAGQRAPQVDGLQREIVRTPDEVAAMLRLWELGWRTRRIAAEFGCSRNTVTRYVGLGGWAPPRVARRPHAGCASNAARTANWRALCASTAPSTHKASPRGCGGRRHGRRSASARSTG